MSDDRYGALFPCPNCGAETYAYGDLLPGQIERRPDQWEPMLMRQHRACTHCIWSTELKDSPDA